MYRFEEVFLSCSLETEWVRKGQADGIEYVSSRRKREGWERLKKVVRCAAFFIGQGTVLFSIRKIEEMLFATL